MKFLWSILSGLGLYMLANMVNDVEALYRPGRDITAKASVALTGKRCCAISGNRTSGPGLSATDDGGVYQVGLPAAGGRVFGVVGYDVASGGMVPVKRNGVLPIKAGAAINAFQEVEVDATGQVIPKAAGIAIGVCLTGAASGADAEIQLYNVG